MGYVLRFQSADSYHSMPSYPIKKIFPSQEEAEKEAKTQPGYGLGIDWFVEEWKNA